MDLHTTHFSALEGLELFDNGEVEDMDPAQRQVLEVSSKAMHRGGFERGGRAFIGVFTGCDYYEWPLVIREAGAEVDMSASLLSSHFSYFMNLSPEPA